MQIEIKNNQTKPSKNLIKFRLKSLKVVLANMDYKTSKHADGEYTESEWQAIVAERQALRTKIKELEKDLESGNGG